MHLQAVEVVLQLGLPRDMQTQGIARNISAKLPS